MALVVRVTVTQVINENVGDRMPGLTALTQLHVKCISQVRELIAGCGRVVEQVKHQRWVEPKAYRIVKITYDAPSRAQKRRRAT